MLFQFWKTLKLFVKLMILVLTYFIINYYSKKKSKNGFKVLPAICPDSLPNFNTGNYGNYLNELEKTSGSKICNFDDLVHVMGSRFHYFDSLGGSLSDHGLNNYYFVKMNRKQLDRIIQKAKKSNHDLNSEEIYGYQIALIEALMKLNKQYGWTMQYHLNVMSNCNPYTMNKLQILALTLCVLSLLYRKK